MRLFLDFCECRYATIEVLKKYKPTARSYATSPARRPTIVMFFAGKDLSIKHAAPKEDG